MVNSIIFAAVGIFLLFIVLSALRTRRTVVAEAEAEEEERLFESKGEIPKLPRNETLYHIFKTNTLNVNKITFDLNYVFDEVASLLRSDTHSPKVEVLFDVDSNVPEHLIGSPKRISRVLINLLENAIQYSDEGVVQMNVSVLQNSGVDCRLRFTICDQGRGMDAELLNTLKDDPVTRVKDGKTPYGTYIATAIIMTQGGSIKFESVPQKGTTVTFDMKFKLPQTHEVQQRHMPSKACKDLRVAVVVRHAQTAKILRKHLAPVVGELSDMIAEKPLLSTRPFEGYNMVIVDHALCERSISYALKSQGIRSIMMRSVFEYAPGENHLTSDYILSVPFTHVRLMDMLSVFYGEEASPVAKVGTAHFGTFVSDGDIPVAANVSRKDFDRFMGAKLLIVEDNPINQRLIQGLLGESGIHLYFADNGKEAIEVVTQEAPLDLVLMDVNMPVMDGLEATRELREDARFKTLPIVAFTGLNLKEQIENMKEAGMNAHMSKPLNIGRLYTLFDHYLPKAGSGRMA